MQRAVQSVGIYTANDILESSLHFISNTNFRKITISLSLRSIKRATERPVRVQEQKPRTCDLIIREGAEGTEVNGEFPTYRRLFERTTHVMLVRVYLAQVST